MKSGDQRPRKLSYVTQVIFPELQLPSQQNVKQLGTRSICSERLRALSEHHKQNGQVSADSLLASTSTLGRSVGRLSLPASVFGTCKAHSAGLWDRAFGMVCSLHAKMPGAGLGEPPSLCLISGTRGRLCSCWGPLDQRGRTCPAGSLSQSPQGRKGEKAGPEGGRNTWLP